ncbi:MAG TPA: alkaline phosphatase family protein [Fulvivirga sp.]|nr:alkaline phosphatase family protein [Fulvivirga sp.]
MRSYHLGLNLLCIILVLSACNQDESIVQQSTPNFLTKKVIIISIDGPRLTESWTSATEENIPNQRNMATQGVFFDNFYNEGTTKTMSGHSAITTGRYETIANDGSELPFHHSIFQQFLSTTLLPPEKSWIIGSKAKLAALGDTKDLDWRGSFSPRIDTEDRADAETILIALQVLKEYSPILSLIHFKEPDTYGHANNWEKYKASIRATDEYVQEIWDYIQSDPFYRDQTALFITNDHGRHLDGIGTGFVGHGDKCEGCRHISLLALGPDFDKNKIVSDTYGQIDIAPTIAKLLGMEWEGEGEPITELVK